MNSDASSFDLPRRQSLSTQAAEALERAIAEGTWEEFIPSERRLCELLQVSRPTIRTALQILAKNGVIEIRQGRRNRLLRAAPQSPHRNSRLIGIVTPVPFEQLAVAAYKVISQMRTHLAEHGFTTEVLVCPSKAATAPRKRLEEFLRRNRVLCCVLASVSKDLQDWFTKHAVPCLVLGSCHPEIHLPALDIDYRSVCRHAVGTLLAKGHRRIALLIPDSGVAGDLASEQGFRDAFAAPRYVDAAPLIVRHQGTAAHLALKLDALMLGPQPPTALLVAKAPNALSVLIHLLKRGLSVPEDVSLVCRDHDPLFETVNPPLSHYLTQDAAFAHRLLRLMQQLVTHGYLPPEPTLIFPKYFAGGTLKAPPR
jgi:LacI family transcriptional regulator